MVFYLKVYEHSKCIFDGEAGVEVTNSFVPENIWVESVDEDGVKLKVQQYLNCKFSFVNLDNNYDCYFSGYLVLTSEYGEMQLLMVYPTCFKNGLVNGNIALNRVHDIDNLDEFVVKDYSKI